MLLIAIALKIIGIDPLGPGCPFLTLLSLMAWSGLISRNVDATFERDTFVCLSVCLSELASMQTIMGLLIYKEVVSASFPKQGV